VAGSHFAVQARHGFDIVIENFYPGFDYGFERRAQGTGEHRRSIFLHLMDFVRHAGDQFATLAKRQRSSHWRAAGRAPLRRREAPAHGALAGGKGCRRLNILPAKFEPPLRSAIRHSYRRQNLIFGQFHAIAVRIADVNRIARTFAVHARPFDLDAFGFKIFDQFF
jgi:hypothetical protein